MIIKGKSRAAASQLAGYLLKLGKNERVELKEASATMSQKIGDAFREMEMIASLSQCEKFLYHASINPKAGEHLTPEQWAKAVDTLEKKLGLGGHQRVIVEHVKDGRAHRHIVWNRVDVENLHAVKMSHNYRAHEEVSRDLERQFGLDRVQGAHVERDGQPRPDRQPEQWAIEAGKRTGVNPHQMKAEVSKIWEQSDGGKAFSAALDEHGYKLARGDRKEFVIVDGSGVVHGISRRTGASAAEVRAKLSDLNPAETPSVQHAKEMQDDAKRQREATREKEHSGHLAATLYDRGDMVSTQRDAMRHMKDAAHSRANNEQRKRQEETEAAKEITFRDRKKADEKPGNQREAKATDKKARTEQSDAALAQRQKQAMRELFEFKSTSGQVNKERFEERERER